jgi:hypothetical protein
MLYKRRSRNRDTFSIISDCHKLTFSTPTRHLTTENKSHPVHVHHKGTPIPTIRSANGQGGRAGFKKPKV